MAPRRTLGAIALLASVGLLAGATAYAQQSSDSRWPEVQGRGVCFTPTGWCPLNGTAPVGTPCYCTIPPRTAVYGTVTNHWYRGRVNPYFNPFPGETVPPTLH